MCTRTHKHTHLPFLLINVFTTIFGPSISSSPCLCEYTVELNSSISLDESTQLLLTDVLYHTLRPLCKTSLLPSLYISHLYVNLFIYLSPACMAESEGLTAWRRTNQRRCPNKNIRLESV